MRRRLFLLDAYALIFRGHYALIKNPRISSKGLNTSAILGFTNSLFNMMRKERPHHLAIVFDKGDSVARIKLSADYKVNREEIPEVTHIAIPYIHQILNALHILTTEKEGYETDDIIGTLTK